YADDQEISATQRHGWLLHHVDREQFQEPHEHAEHRAEETDAADQEDPQEQRDPAAQDSFDEQQGYEQQDGYELQEGTEPSPGQDESAATAEQSSYDDLAVDEQSQQGEASESIELATDDGWTASSENDAQSGAWVGDALSST